MTKWAIIGTSGFAGQTCVPTLLEASAAELLGSCGSSPEGGSRVAQRFSLPKAYASLADVAADPDVEAVWIASPTGFHAEQAIALMEAGKSVLIEKPLALTLAEAGRVKRRAEQVGAKAAVGFHQRFKSAHIRAREAIGAGLLGKLAYIRCHFLAAYDEEPGPWRRSATTAGGGWSVNDIGTHLLDTVRFVTQSDVVAAKAVFGHVRFGYETDDIFAGVLKLQNGTLASIEAATAVAAPTTRLELVGERGSIVIDGSFMNRSSLVINGGAPETADESQAYVRQIEAFQSLLEGSPTRIATLDDGVANVEWVGAMIQS